MDWLKRPPVLYFWVAELKQIEDLVCGDTQRGNVKGPKKKIMSLQMVSSDVDLAFTAQPNGRCWAGKCSY